MKYRDRRQFLIDQVHSQSPDISTQPGDIVTTLIEAQAELGAQADVAAEEVLQWSFDELSGRDLDAVADMFGFTRRPALPATGYVTIRFGGPLTRGYRLEQGSLFVSEPSGKTFAADTNIAMLRGFTTVNIPVAAVVPGPGSNTPPHSINRSLTAIEHTVEINNYDAITGGKSAETDEELRTRMVQNLMRSRLGSEDYYVDVCYRHPRVNAAQMIKPMQRAQETLKIVGGKAVAQEDSVAYTYEDGISVYHPQPNATGRWMEPGVDYIVTTDNLDVKPPVFHFQGNRWDEGDYVNVTYYYNSVKSRNEPAVHAMHFLDLYVSGRQPFPYIDKSFWPQDNEVGKGVVTNDTHPNAPQGRPYYVFTRQPVSFLPASLDVGGVTYTEGFDYMLSKDASRNANSARARDAIVWLRALPPGTPYPIFNIDYFADSVVQELQNAIDDPSAHAATDDVLIHSADEIPFRFYFDVEWRAGVIDNDSLRIRLEDFLANVPMGGTLQVGPLLGHLYRLTGIQSIALAEEGVQSDRVIRGASKWTHTIPLVDGSVPIVADMIVRNIASNAY